jgi:hypothetical protein
MIFETKPDAENDMFGHDTMLDHEEEKAVFYESSLT